jgi:DNA polymerase-3 subunit beta
MMNITCERSKLLAAAQAASEVAPTRPTRPIVQGVLLELTSEGLQLSATDYDVGIRYSLEVKAKQGSDRVVVNAGQLLSVVRDLPEGDVRIDAEEAKLVLTAGGSRLSLPCMDESDFPEVTGLGTDRAVKLAVGDVVGMLEKVAYAAGQEESRYAINGVYLKLMKRELEVVATDTRRLALMRRKLSKDTKLERNAILPLKLVAMVRKLSTGVKEIQLVLRESEVVFGCGPAVVVGRLVEGTYPKYEEVIPDDCDRVVVVPREPFRAALRQCANFTTEETRAVDIRVGEGKVVLEAGAAERGDASIVIEVDYQGPELEVTFNPQYVLDAVAKLERKDVELRLKDSSRPGVITEGKEYLSLIMPVRLRGG